MIFELEALIDKIKIELLIIHALFPQYNFSIGKWELSGVYETQLQSLGCSQAM